MSEWKPMDEAPMDGTEIQAKIPGNGSDNVIAWQVGAFMNEHGSCGGWAFTREGQEPPDCWTDGVCWQENEDGIPSVRPTEWKHLPHVYHRQPEDIEDTSLSCSWPAVSETNLNSRYKE